VSFGIQEVVVCQLQYSRGGGLSASIFERGGCLSASIFERLLSVSFNILERLLMMDDNAGNPREKVEQLQQVSFLGS